MIVLRSNPYLSKFRKDGIVIIFSIFYMAHWVMCTSYHTPPPLPTTIRRHTIWQFHIFVHKFWNSNFKKFWRQLISLCLYLSIYPHIRSYIYLKTIINVGAIPYGSFIFLFINFEIQISKNFGANSSLSVSIYLSTHKVLYIPENYYNIWGKCIATFVR